MQEPCADQSQSCREADPEPGAATREEELVRDRDRAHEHEDRRQRAERDHDEALGRGRGELEAPLPQHDDEDGEQATWITGLVLALSALTGWYSGQGEGVTVSVIGWHTGVLGKLVLAIGLLAILVVALRQWGIDLPAAVPESLVVIALGALATIFVLVRAISIPDEFFFAGRGIGLWISLLASVALIGAGLLRASEEL